MFASNLKIAEKYDYLNDRFRKAYQWLRKNDPTKMECGKYQIVGDDVYAMVQSYDTQPQENRRFETHEKYFDIQYVAEGIEKFGRQLGGFAAIAAFTAISMAIVFFAIKKTIGLRASEYEEITGLDITEHGLMSSYADFAPSHSDMGLAAAREGKAAEAEAPAAPKVPVDKAIEVENYVTPSADGKEKLTLSSAKSSIRLSTSPSKHE